jgi:serine/threonine-protein phosphatase 4 regulatory subunit 1
MAVPLSAEVRGTVLLNAYSRLLQDSNKHVRTGAYLHLGPFMATLKSSQVSMGMVQLFCSMADEEDLKLQAAFQLPSVVLTIGRGRWFELRECYLSLCRSENSKVRRTLACSLHEVAKILGSELCENDLLPVFETFANDADAVRSGITANLAQFLQSVRRDLVTTYLPLLGELLGKAASMDWRARELIARQVDGLAVLLNPEAAEAVLVPIVFDLLRDHVAQVRKIAVDAIPSLLKALFSEAGPQIQSDVVTRLRAFATSEFFQERQTFVQFSACIFASEHEGSALAAGFLRLLVPLAADQVTGVRISVGKVASAFPPWIQATENGRKVAAQSQHDKR